MKIYLAGPDVFLPDAVGIGRRKAEICAHHGVTGLYPLDNDIDLLAPDASLQIFRGNEAMMNEANAVIANLTPFRGPGADAGTVYDTWLDAASSASAIPTIHRFTPIVSGA
jgi:nucleoside 2-deoxyribosyltransferase